MRRVNIPMSGETATVWIQNCLDCLIPMALVHVEQEDEPILGIPESMKYHPRPSDFYTWAGNPVLNTLECWYCDKCKTVWAPGPGQHWVKTTWQGTVKDVSGPVITPGPVPYEGATLCPHCHVWRESHGDLQVCPKCNTGERIRTYGFESNIKLKELV